MPAFLRDKSRAPDQCLVGALNRYQAHGYHNAVAPRLFKSEMHRYSGVAEETVWIPCWCNIGTFKALHAMVAHSIIRSL